MRVHTVVFLLAAGSGVLNAQSLTVVANAAAPVRDDSIYALRVNPAEYRGQDDVLLLDEGTVRVEADGRSTYTLRHVAQLLTTDGVEHWGELSFWYKTGRQQIHINWIKVIGPDGAVVRDGPAHEQEVRPPAEPGAPVFSDRRAIQVTLAGLAPGTVVDYSYTLETLQPAMPGDFLFYWYLNGGTAVRRSRFTFDAPADLKTRVEVRNLAGTPEDTVVAGRRIRRWNVADIPQTVWQRYAGTPNDVIASIRVGGDVSWRAVGAWYDSLARDRYQVTPEILAAQARELRGALTLEDSLRDTYRWVAQDFRYVSLSLGDGSYQPRLPREVYETRFGDCKDKTTLFVSLARRMGVVAYPVLVQSDGPIDTLLPSMRHFDHVIAGVEQGGTTRYLDVTSSLAPYGEVPPQLQGEPGLAVHGGNAGIVILPASAPAHNRYDEDIAGTFRRDGSFVGHVTISATGTEQYELRDQLAGLDAKEKKTRDETLRQFALSTYASAVVDSARYADGNDIGTPPSATIWFTAGRVLGQVGGRYYFNLPLSRFGSAASLTRLDAEGERRFPIDVAQVNSPSVYRSSLEVELPENWQAELPREVSVDGPFGYYRAEYQQAGRMLRVSREMGGLRGLLPPDSLPALRAWLQAVANDRTTMIVLSRGTGMDLAVAGAAESTSRDVGTLQDIVLGVADLSAGARLAREGEADASSNMLQFSSTEPLESYQRVFAADKVVFSVGGSRLTTLQATAAAFHTRAEACWTLDFLRVFELSGFMRKYMSQATGEQISLDSTRTLALQGIGDRAAGWVFELATPLASFDMAVLLSVRGRTSTTLMAVGPKGLRDEDLAALLRTMDDRVRQRQEYLVEVPPGSTQTKGQADADSALATATSLALNSIPVPPPDSAGLTVRTASFERDNGWPEYTLTVEGRGLTFPLGNSNAIELEMAVTLHGDEAQALKAVVKAERTDHDEFIRTAMRGMGDVGDLANAFVGGDSSTIDAVPMSRLGARSYASHVRLRGMVRVDVDQLTFAVGRLTASISVTRPAGASDPRAVEALARDMLQRMRLLLPGEASPPPASLVAAVGRVVDAERAVDSLVDARNIEAAFRTIDHAHLARAPVGFSTSTWNSLCWWASLEGQAKRASAACDAAVAPDTTVLSYRDSRGLERALTGDLEGARRDFAYVVANAARGDFYDTRAAWLSTLRAGQNPFTPEVLAKLREN